MLVRKTVTALFCDLDESVALAEQLDPEALRRVHSRYFDAMREVLERHGGTVEKFIGDAVVAVFGIPQLHEDDALRAVRSAVELRARLRELNEELERDHGVRLEIQVGIDTGDVAVGGDADYGTLATGEAMNLAARLQQAAGPGEILIGKATYALVRDAVVAGPLESFPVKGKREDVGRRRLDEVDAHAPGFARRLDAPLVGREGELARLLEAFERAERERSCRVLTVLGAAGIGKSRLAGELIERLRGRATALTGRCLPYGDGITFWPLAQIVHAAGDAAAIAAALGDDPDAALIAERVRGAIGAAGPGGAEETFWAVRRFLEALARPRPLVVVLEDIHWAQPTFLDLVEYVAGWSRDAPILLLCLARPDLLDVRPGWTSPRPNTDAIALEPLGPEEAVLLLEALGGELGERRRSEIAVAAEGNPLFVEQMVAMLAEADGAAVPSVPPSIQALLAERLDRLDAGERAVIERAAVVGREFSRAAVRALTPPGERDSTSARLMSLVRRELIRPLTSPAAREDTFRFHHGLIRDVAYAGIAKELRADLHCRFAEWLEASAGERAGELEEIVGYHLEQACAYREQLGPVGDETRALAARAASHLASAARRAFAGGDMPAAAAMFVRATLLLRDDDHARLQLAPELGDALVEASELARADALLAKTARDAAALGDRRIEWRARATRVVARLHLDPEARADELLHEAERAIAVFDELGDDHGLVVAWHAVSALHHFASRWAARTDALERALAYARSAGDRRRQRMLLGSLALSLDWGPTPVGAAVARCEAMLAEAHGERIAEGRIRAVLGDLRAMQGRFSEARDLYERSKRELEELALPLLVGVHTLVRGSIELLAGEPRAAEEELRFGCRLLEEIGDVTSRSTLLAVLAEALLAQGRVDEAEQASRESEAISAADDVASQTLWRATRAKALALRGDDSAVRFAREAVALASATDALNLHAEALVALADAAGALASPEEAAAARAEAIALYEAKGNVAAAARARSGAGIAPTPATRA